ncbi:hypothetical protein ACQ7HM_06325 [Williamsia sp. MIQD14]|uniref:hypothetical protein n=1 Tax=Williamsia sp. MIQD14 TaxID=3425703 RepID=UPI003DA08A83
MHDGCWSTVICTGAERSALGDTTDTGWVLGCRLSIGHRGDHATDAEVVPRFDRRLWLEWNDRDQHAQSLIDRNPCSAPGRCMLFEGHGGDHWFAPVNGHAPSVGGGRRHVGGPNAPGLDTSGPDIRADTNGHGSTTTVARFAHPEPPAPADPLFDPPRLEAPRPAAPSGDAPGRPFPSGDIPTGDHPTGDIPNLRSRAVRTTPDVDAHRDVPAGPSVADALDEVVAALSRLAEAVRLERSRPEGRTDR